MNYTAVSHDTGNNAIFILDSVAGKIEITIRDMARRKRVFTLDKVNKLSDDEYWSEWLTITDTPECVEITRKGVGTGRLELTVEQRVHFFDYLDRHSER